MGMYVCLCIDGNVNACVEFEETCQSEKKYKDVSWLRDRDRGVLRKIETVKMVAGKPEKKETVIG